MAAINNYRNVRCSAAVVKWTNGTGRSVLEHHVNIYIGEWRDGARDSSHGIDRAYVE